MRAELLRAGADARVHAPRSAAASSRAMRRISPASIPHAPATASGVNSRTSVAQLVEAVEVLGERAGRLEPLLDDRARHRGEQERVGAGLDEVMLVRLLGGAGATRVHDHDLAAALADAAQPAAHVGRGEQAAVRDQRVRAQHDEVVAAVHVGDRDRQHRSEHQPRRHLLRHLVDGRRRVEVLRPEHAQPRGPVDQRGQVVGVRVAEVDGHRVLPVLGDQRREPAVDLLERLVPARLHQLAVAADQRRGQPVRILVELLDPVRLRADEAVAEHVVHVAADRDHLPSLGLDLEAAGGFAERAGPVVRGHARDPTPPPGAARSRARVTRR